MKTLRLFLLAGLFLNIATFSMAAENWPAQRLEEFRAHIAALSSLTFNFSQKTSGQMSGKTRLASGQAYLSRTGNLAKIRWNYQLPSTQVILSDGKEIRMYFEKQHQLIISPADTLQQDITYSLFTGSTDIAKDFKIEQIISERDLPLDPPSGTKTSSAEDEEEIEGYKLTPIKPSTTTQYLTIWISQNNRLKRVTLVDSFDTVTELTFSHIQENTLRAQQSAELFQFSPPAGTEIIHQ